ncbi:hypothetical protein MKW92_026310 [Papaver armeniacum]|nr:hypothetical protein MKW92_026310 [Papaver armeniacum]
MDSESANSSASPPVKEPVTQTPVISSEDSSSRDAPSLLSASGISSWAKSLKLPQPLASTEEDTANAGKSTFSRFTSGFGLLSPKDPVPNESAEGTSTTPETGVLGSFTKGLVDTSRNAVKAVQVKARHMVSQNKRRYQEGGFDLDMTYITENIIAMGFPAGDMSSGLFWIFRVYNLCSERLYDAALFEGKVASFPFDDHNCPPIHLIKAFCQSAYSWLKEDIENVVVVHCKAGMARTGLMITSLLLFLKFFPTAEESIDYYNQKRCIDGKGLVLPSQIRYVKYFERILTYFNGENQPGRRCPYWIRPSITISDHNGVLFSTKTHARTKDLMPEDFWFSSPKKGIMVFALPGEPGLTELNGDFKIHFHDRQGDFYCWLNTTMTENRKVLKTSDLDGFDKRKLPSPGFQVEIVMIDYDGTIPTKSKTEVATNKESPAGGSSGTTATTGDQSAPASKPNKDSENQDKDDVFSDTESEGSVSSKKRHGQMSSSAGTATTATNDPKTGVAPEEMADVLHVELKMCHLEMTGVRRTPRVK